MNLKKVNPTLWFVFAVSLVVAVVLVAEFMHSGHQAIELFETELEPNSFITEAFDEYGVEQVSIAHEEYGPDGAVELRCAVYVKWHDGRAVCITDTVEEVAK